MIKVYFSEPDSLNVCITFQVHYVYDSCRIRKHMLFWCRKVMRIVSFLNLTKLLFLKTEFKRVNWRLSKYLIYPKEPLQLTLHIYICKVNKHNFRQAWKIGDVSELTTGSCMDKNGMKGLLIKYEIFWICKLCLDCCVMDKCLF